MAHAVPVTGAILAGGLGTRLRDALPDTPKPLAPVEGRPFLHWLFEQLRSAGVSPIVLCTGYLGSQVRARIGTEYEGVPILYSEESHPLGTGGALALAWRNHPGTAPWLVMNGDSYVGIDLAALVDAHHGSGLAATVAATRVGDASRYGRLEWDSDRRITAFHEKNPGGAAAPGWINAGVYLFEAAFLDALGEPAGPLSLECEAFPGWIPRGIRAFPSEARFIDIGTPESYRLAQTFFG